MSDKSPVACLRVQMAPPICLFNTEGMWRMHCANSLPHPPIHHALPFLQTPFWPRPRCQGCHSSHHSLLSAITQVWQGHLNNLSWHGIIVTSLCNYPPLLASTTKVLMRSLLFLPSFWDVFSKVTSLYSIFADFRSLSRFCGQQPLFGHIKVDCIMWTSWEYIILITPTMIDIFRGP